MGDLHAILRWGRAPGEGNGNPLQYSGLGNPMHRGAWQATVHGVAKIQTGPSDFHLHFSLSALEGFPDGTNLPANVGGMKDMSREDPLEEIRATHSSILAWRIPWTEEPGGP